MHKLNKTHSQIPAASRLYQCPFPLIALTGCIATGKSTVAQVLVEKGFHLIDADQLIKQIYTLPKTIEFIMKLCPESLEAQSINFKILRKKVFEDSELKRKLEDFLYPMLPAQFADELKKLAPKKDEIVLYDIPLLFEKNLSTFFDLTVAVYTPAEIQLERLLTRDKISIAEAKKIITNQISIEEKKSLAHYVIDNSRDLEFLNHQINLFIKMLT